MRVVNPDLAKQLNELNIQIESPYIYEVAAYLFNVNKKFYIETNYSVESESWSYTTFVSDSYFKYETVEDAVEAALYDLLVEYKNN